MKNANCFYWPKLCTVFKTRAYSTLKRKRNIQERIYTNNSDVFIFNGIVFFCETKIRFNIFRQKKRSKSNTYVQIYQRITVTFNRIEVLPLYGIFLYRFNNNASYIWLLTKASTKQIITDSKYTFYCLSCFDYISRLLPFHASKYAMRIEAIHNYYANHNFPFGNG